MRFPLLGLLLILVRAPLIVGQQNSQGTVPNSPEGFDRQYREAFNAFRKGDQQRMKLTVEQFALPSHWFPDMFGPDEGSQLAELYSNEFKDFESVTIRKLGSVPQCLRCFVSLQAKLMHSTQVKMVMGSGEPGAPSNPILPLPAMQRFEIHYTGEELEEEEDGTGHTFTRQTPLGNFTWVDSFIYVDGAFRFYGRGDYSYLDPAMIRRADPCAPNGRQSGGHLIHRIDPVNPAKAKDRVVEGVVRVLVTVAENGSVNGVKVVDGNSLLVESARQAVMQWTYEPFIQCGKPVEMRTFEHIKFPPP